MASDGSPKLSNSPSLANLTSDAKGFLDFLDDDLIPEKLLHKTHLSKRPSVGAVGFLDFIEPGMKESPKIERIVIKKQFNQAQQQQSQQSSTNSSSSSNSSAMGFLEFAKEDNLDLSFPPHPVLKHASQTLVSWTTQEWQALLLCFRGFVKAVDIINLWATVYFQNKASPEICKLMVDKMKLWVQLYPSDFNQEALERLRDVWAFVVERPTSFTADLGMKEMLSPLFSLTRKSSSEGRRATSDSEATIQTGFHELEPLDVARALTIDEFELFAEVPSLEFIAKGGWCPKDTKTPALDRLTERFNKVSRWVTTSVVCADDGHKLDVFLKFIVVAYRCRQMNNFNTMMEIVAGLNQSPVLLLKNLWSSMPSKIQRKWDDMNALADPLGNFRNYRKELKAKAMLENRKKLPVLPYLPVFMRDCLFFHDGNAKPDLQLMVQFWSTVEQMRRFQQVPYSFTIDQKTSNFLLQNFIVKDEEELFRIAARSRPTVASREEMFGDLEV